MSRTVGRLVAAAVLAWGAPASAAAFAPSLDRPTPVGGEVVLRGELRSSLDGSTFDAVTQRDHYPQLAGTSEPRLGGLFDPAAGGLRVIAQDPKGHVYTLAPSGAEGPACREAGVDSPCLAPRLAALARERLVTAADLAATLGGRIDAEVTATSRAAAPDGSGGVVEWLAAVAALLGATALVRAVRRARAGSTIGQVRAAARAARRALRGDPTLARARERIQALEDRAAELERTRRACAVRLAALEPTRLEGRRAAWARSSAPGADAALAALTAEAGEAERLAADLGAAVAGLERIASALRAAALRARGDRDTRAVAAHDDPVDLLAGELELRDAAAREA